MTPLSIVIITKNEAANIRACLESVSWASEIIVVDSGSIDDTVAICKEFTSHVYVQSDWHGFGVQKNRALGYATMDWIFSIDADERVSAELKAELELAMVNDGIAGFYCPRLSQFCGKFVHHCGWYPDHVLRLFRRGSARFSDLRVHESIIIQGSTAILKSPLLHYSYRTQADVERKVVHYSEEAARQMHRNGRRVTSAGAFLRGGWAFVRTYLFRLGFLDGSTGWNISSMNARTTYSKYWQLSQMRGQLCTPPQ